MMLWWTRCYKVHMCRVYCIYRQYSSEHFTDKEYSDKSARQEQCVPELRTKPANWQQATRRETRLHADTRQDCRRCYSTAEATWWQQEINVADWNETLSQNMRIGIMEGSYLQKWAEQSWKHFVHCLHQVWGESMWGQKHCLDNTSHTLVVLFWQYESYCGVCKQ